jgi:DNA (cytosine-5)-methyltransferase 1
MALLLENLIGIKAGSVDEQIKHVKDVFDKFGISYIEHPNGRQKFPDFIISNGKRFIEVELKSGAQTKIMWNDGFPSENVLYIYSCVKSFKTFVFTIDDIPEFKSAKRMYDDVKLRVNCMNSDQRSVETGTFTFFVRKAISQDIKSMMELKSTDHSLRMLNLFFADTLNHTRDLLPHEPSVKKHRMTAISLFSGAGGDTFGMTMSGLEVVGFVENDRDAVKTHLLNFPESKHIVSLCGERSIVDIPSLVFSVYAPSNIDVVFGGFPCQSFSHGGKKNPDDVRGWLFQEFVRVARVVQPKIVIGENVKGILTKRATDGELFVDKIQREFRVIGYELHYKLFNMSDYGVPQKRMRVIFMGFRNDVAVDLSADKVLQQLHDVHTDSRKAVVRDIIDSECRANMMRVERLPSRLVVPDDKWVVMNTNDTPVEIDPPTNLVKCFTADEITFGVRSGGTFSCVVDIDQPCATILSTYGRMPRLFVAVKSLQGEMFIRPFSTSELAQIQGFPKSYVFAGKYMSVVKQIGNAVPPTFIEKLMSVVQRTF